MKQLTDQQEKQFLFEINKGIDIQSDNEAGESLDTKEIEISGITLMVDADVLIEYELITFATMDFPAEYKMFKTLQRTDTTIWDDDEYEVTDAILDAIHDNLKVY